ncbi:Imm58 family immunity protein [Buttiauxella brennerae]
MKICKIIFISLTVLSIFFNVFFLYNWIDRSISLSYSNQSFDDCNNDLSMLKTLVKSEFKGMDEKNILQQLERNELNKSTLIKGGVLYLGNTEFIFYDGILIDIK